MTQLFGDLRPARLELLELMDEGGAAFGWTTSGEGVCGLRCE
jgi:hypothetical protein